MAVGAGGAVMCPRPKRWTQTLLSPGFWMCRLQNCHSTVAPGTNTLCYSIIFKNRLLTRTTEKGHGPPEPAQVPGVQETPGEEDSSAMQASPIQPQLPSQDSMSLCPRRVTFSVLTTGQPPTHPTVLTETGLFIVGKKIYGFSF